MRNIFFEKSYAKCGGEGSPRTFCKKIKIELIWINSLSRKFIFIVCQSRSLPKYTKTKVLTTCSLYIKLLQKAKRGLELVFLPHLLHDI